MEASGILGQAIEAGLTTLSLVIFGLVIYLIVQLIRQALVPAITKIADMWRSVNAAQSALIADYRHDLTVLEDRLDQQADELASAQVHITALERELAVKTDQLEEAGQQIRALEAQIAGLKSDNAAKTQRIQELERAARERDTLAGEV